MNLYGGVWIKLSVVMAGMLTHGIEFWLTRGFTVNGYAILNLSLEAK